MWSRCAHLRNETGPHRFEISAHRGGSGGSTKWSGDNSADNTWAVLAISAVRAPASLVISSPLCPKPGRRAAKPDSCGATAARPHAVAIASGVSAGEGSDGAPCGLAWAKAAAEPPVCCAHVHKPRACATPELEEEEDQEKDEQGEGQDKTGQEKRMT